MNAMKICIVAHNAYGMISGDITRHIGGVELQTSMMSRWLADRGHDVSLITWDEGGDKVEHFDGVRVIKTCIRDSGVPGLRFFWPRWSSLMAALIVADADVYYQNGAEYVTGQVANWVRRKDRRFVFSVASDVEVYKSLPGLRKVRERVLYKYGISHANEVVAQTDKQVALLESELGISSKKLAMPCVGPADDEFVAPAAPADATMTALFVGRIADVKRIEFLLEVARKAPNIRFLVVGGGNRDEAYATEMETIARGLANVQMHGRASREELADIYPQASVLCCTSKYEGFPNTFLEAWSHGLPIVSTVDPDDLISKHSLGRIASDVPGFVEALQSYVSGAADKWANDSASARDYYSKTHAPDRALERFESMFAHVLSRQ